jgi:carboxymethylenebutenolidase
LVGFSMGGFFAVWMARSKPQDLAAVVLFYGTGAGNFAKTRAAFLGHFAEHDTFVSSKLVGKLEQRVRAAGREIETHVYPGTAHWFFEEDRPDAYDPKAAKQAWGRTVRFLKKHLKA